MFIGPIGVGFSHAGPITPPATADFPPAEFDQSDLTLFPTYSTPVLGKEDNESTEDYGSFYDPNRDEFSYAAIPSIVGERPHSRFAVGVFIPMPTLTQITHTISQLPLAHPTQILVLMVSKRPP